jgi:cadmium resistance protein CadD (predicted permease)
MEAIGRAVGVFAVTNVDDLVIIALFVGRLAGVRGRTARVALGQYLGFGAILVVSLSGAVGAGLLPPAWLPYLGLLPLLLGLREAWELWRERGDDDDGDDDADQRAPGVLAVAAVTIANGGDNLGVYVPLFAVAGVGGQVVYVVVFLVLVAVWVGAGRFLATRAPVARALARWGHVVMPVVLVGIGVAILVEGGAFGL